MVHQITSCFLPVHPPSLFWKHWEDFHAMGELSSSPSISPAVKCSHSLTTFFSYLLWESCWCSWGLIMNSKINERHAHKIRGFFPWCPLWPICAFRAVLCLFRLPLPSKAKSFWSLPSMCQLRFWSSEANQKKLSAPQGCYALPFLSLYRRVNVDRLLYTG